MCNLIDTEIKLKDQSQGASGNFLLPNNELS